MSIFDGTYGPTLTLKFYINGSWVSVTTTDIREIDLKRGRPRADQKNDPGSATIIFDNASGYYDPEYTGSSSPYVVSGVNQLRAGVKCQILATWSGTDYPLFTGYLETSTVDQGFSPTATMTFTDGIALLSKMYPAALSTPGYSGETTHDRVSRMLTFANWVDGTALSSSCTVQMCPTTQSSSLQLMIEEAVACEAGRFYISTNGTATFTPLQDKFSRVTRLQLSDTRATNTIEYDALTATPGSYQVINDAIIERTGKTTRHSRHLPSTTAFGLKTVTIQAPILNDSDADNMAKYLAFKDANPATLIESVSFQTANLGTLWPDFLSLEIGDNILMNRTTIDGRSLGSSNTPAGLHIVVEGYTQSITPDSWTCQIMSSPMNPYSITI